MRKILLIGIIYLLTISFSSYTTTFPVTTTFPTYSKGNIRETPLYTSVEIIDGVPVICLNGKPFHITGWVAFGQYSIQELKKLMDLTRSQGFNVIEIPANWREIEQEHDHFSWNKMDDLMGYANQKGLYVILWIQIGLAPPWWADSIYPDAVFFTVDPDIDQHEGQLHGRLAIPGVSSIPIFYHPAYYEELNEFVSSLINRYKDHPALFGWSLALGATGEYNYPGGSYYNIAGFADYSNYTINLYKSIFDYKPPHPLKMFSQSSPDLRAPWLNWTRWRLERKREVFEHFASMIKSIDPDHILTFRISAFSYEMGSGYLAETSGGADYYPVLVNSYVDVIRAPVAVREDFLQVIDDLYYKPYMHLVLSKISYRWRKPLLLYIGKSREFFHSADKITAVAGFYKSLGYDLHWVTIPNDLYLEEWDSREKKIIKSTGGISKLPKIKGLTEAEFAFIDMPFASGKYYADKTLSLKYAMKQVHAFMDAGLPFDCLSADEIMKNPDVLNSYKAIGFLHPDMYRLFAPKSLKEIISDWKENGGIVWNGSPLDGWRYYKSGYKNTTYLDMLRNFYDENDIRRHRYEGHFVYITGNKPYIFMLSRDYDYKGKIEIDVKGWNLSNGEIKLIEYNALKVYDGIVFNGRIILNVTLKKQKPYLFVLSSYYLSASIEKPREGYLYILDREVRKILSERAVVIGKITIEVETFRSIRKVEFYIDGRLKAIDKDEPYSWLWNEFAIGRHEIKTVAYDNKGNKAEDKMDVIIFNLGGRK